MSAPFIIDMRCLQHPDYAERGIGNHARCIVTHAPAPFIGLVDPALPALPRNLAKYAAELVPHGYVPGLAAGAVFLNPSPMGPDQNFLARLLLDKRVVKAACVHDFIPHDAPETYLASTGTRLDYYTAMAWLRKYSIYFPVSEDTEARLKSLFGAVRAVVTGAALPEWAETQVPGDTRHILMVGGGDARKNPELLVRAHAGSDVLRRLPLVITGQYPPEFCARAAHVELPGRLSDSGLRQLYAGAVCVVTPSRSEGFSLPVIEAMAAGTPAIVSDIPAHRALVPDAGSRFAPDDEGQLTAILEDVVTNPARRAAIIQAQSGAWRKFTGNAVAEKIWTSLGVASPFVKRGLKPRLAMLTPLPPAKSGVADYSAALLPELAKRTELDVFSGARISALAHLSAKYDAVVSVIGNSPYHAEIYEQAVARGSAVICHDSRLLGLAAWRAGEAGCAGMASRELDRLVTPSEVAKWIRNENIREASFLGDLAAAARPLVFHSRQPVELVRRRFGVEAAQLPFAMQRVFEPPSEAEKAAARAALKLYPGQKVIASFGFIGRLKGINAALRAFAQLRRRVDAILVFVGEHTDVTPVYEALAWELGIAHAVKFGTEFVSEAAYRGYLLAADAGLQLREGGLGNISGALQDCVAAGLPSVATRDLAENIDAPGYVTRVGDMLDPAEIAQALEGVLGVPRSGLEKTRVAQCERYSMARYSEGLLRVLGF